ncbi:DUF1778 domain-containing protein [Vibrio parahaemolyticus]|uniref:type II toxin -antitoxin system TacA 1-like antitoxin n=1 Tax=Vibrio parahaemolyticus TaxID=670 RepID=UPI0006C3E4A3|nr:DUF1778 domain-containing protein [Vibrio parahaemolyticus]EGR3229041.1 DUF1778 domain-containing protein [Vibrio parahaemolyticus]EJG0181448.1 DUF1778 domain-containing protein [Vibrio parahaemolyticus]KOY41152.1 hypothetical protein ACX10_02265 [Vibrio parahaemolyticus]MCS0117199.1 DUF1778 domain-containing protein [Vibrio parahaemolyticus]
MSQQTRKTDLEKSESMSESSQDNVTLLSEESFDKLTNILENPPKPTQAMKDLMSKPRLTKNGNSL